VCGDAERAADAEQRREARVDADLVPGHDDPYPNDAAGSAR
jgi:hypothetical protein